MSPCEPAIYVVSKKDISLHNIQLNICKIQDGRCWHVPFMAFVTILLNRPHCLRRFIYLKALFSCKIHQGKMYNTQRVLVANLATGDCIRRNFVPGMGDPSPEQTAFFYMVYQLLSYLLVQKHWQEILCSSQSIFIGSDDKKVSVNLYCILKIKSYYFYHVALPCSHVKDVYLLQTALFWA